jgi:uncharacterized iron-regulated membrane protein
VGRRLLHRPVPVLSELAQLAQVAGLPLARRGHKLNFDLHRSGGVWVWLLLLVLAITSVSMNLPTQVMRPLVAQFSRSARTPSTAARRSRPASRRAAADARAGRGAGEDGGRKARLDAAGRRRVYSSAYGLYGVGFFRGGSTTMAMVAWAMRGCLRWPRRHACRRRGANTGSADDIFLQAQFPHSGRILGLPGRILISAMGLVVAMLSATD